MATEEKTPLRIVVGSDNAGHAYKTALKEVLKKHSGVTHVLDVGVVDADDGTAYPHLAVDAAKLIKSGEVCTLYFVLLHLSYGCVVEVYGRLGRGGKGGAGRAKEGMKTDHRSSQVRCEMWYETSCQ